MIPAPGYGRLGRLPPFACLSSGSNGLQNACRMDGRPASQILWRRASIRLMTLSVFSTGASSSMVWPLALRCSNFFSAFSIFVLEFAWIERDSPRASFRSFPTTARGQSRAPARLFLPGLKLSSVAQRLSSPVPTSPRPPRSQQRHQRGSRLG